MTAFRRMSGLSDVESYARAAAPTLAAVSVGSRIGLWLTIWRASAQLFYVAVTLLVFANLQDRSATITAALFGLVYASIRATTIANVFAFRRMTLVLDNEIRVVKKAVLPGLGPEPAPDDDIRKAVERLDRPLLLEYGGLAIIGLICLYYLFWALLYGASYQQLFELK
jgi:hypothetical protein